MRFVVHRRLPQAHTRRASFHRSAPTEGWHFCSEKGYSLRDIVAELLKFVVRMKFLPPVQAFLMSSLARVEYNLAFATSEKLQLAGLIGVFTEARFRTAQLKKGES